MNRQDASDRFEFQKHGIVHDYVRAVAFVEVHLFVNDGERDFASHVQAIVSKFPTEAFLIDALPLLSGE
jgi:hypothetical protein